MDFIDYVEVKVTNKLSGKSITGLFAGISELERKNGVKFNIVRLLTKPNTYMFSSLEFFYIKLVKVKYAKSTLQTFYKDKDSDQERAIKDLDFIVNEKLSSIVGMFSENGFLNVRKYINVPEAYKSNGRAIESKRETKNNNTAKSNAGTNNSSNTTKNACGFNSGYSNSSFYNGTSNYSYLKKPTITFIKRTSDTPESKFLETLLDKVKEIAKGTFKPNIPEVEADKEKEDDIKNIYRNWYHNRVM